MLYSYHKGISKYLLNDGFDDRHYIILFILVFIYKNLLCGVVVVAMVFSFHFQIKSSNITKHLIIQSCSFHKSPYPSLSQYNCDRVLMTLDRY